MKTIIALWIPMKIILVLWTSPYKYKLFFDPNIIIFTIWWLGFSMAMSAIVTEWLVANTITIGVLHCG